MTKKYKEVFIVYRDSEGVYHRDSSNDYLPVKLAVIRPTHKHQQLSQEIYTRRWKELVEQGAPLRTELNDILKKRKLWNDDMQAQEEELLKKIEANLKKVKGRLKISEAIKAMKDNLRLKAELIVLRFNRNQLDENTAEAMADQHRFNFLVSVCTVTEDNKPFFSSFEEFLTQDDEGNPVPTIAGEAFWRLTTDLDTDYRKDWPEYQFLQKYKLVDDKLQFLKDGKPVDINDNPLESQVKEELQFGEMLDDEGNVIQPETV